MNNRLMWIMTRTPLHVGAGSSLGAIDMPVARERHTQIPIVPGSGLKGVLRDLFSDEADHPEQESLFGPDCDTKDLFAGVLTIGEARTVCFPVRSAAGAFAWVTCPMALQRLARELGRPLGPIVIDDATALAGKEVVVGGSSLILEEYAFKADTLPEPVIALLADAFPGDEMWKSLNQRLVVLSDTLFVHFCANACEVQQRVRIDDESGTVRRGGLFNQENVPAETIFYSVIGQRSGTVAGDYQNGGALQRLSEKLEQTGNVLQIGGDATVGLGFCTVRLTEGGGK